MPRNRWRWAVRASTPYVCLKLSPPATCPHPTPPVSLPLHQEATSGLQLIPETQQLLTGPVKAQAKNCYLLNLQPHAVHRLLAWCRLIWRWQSLMENFLWISMGSGSRHSYQASSVTVMCEIWQERSRKKKKKRAKELTTGKFLPNGVINEHCKSKPEVGERVCFYKKPVKLKKKKNERENLAVGWIWQIILAGENG